jgi:DNA-binding transcriptional LysR family regulator
MNSSASSRPGTTPAMKSFAIETGFGTAPLPVAVIRRELAAGELLLLDVEPPLPPLPVVACVRLEPASPPADQFVQMAREVCDEFMQASR